MSAQEWTEHEHGSDVESDGGGDVADATDAASAQRPCPEIRPRPSCFELADAVSFVCRVPDLESNPRIESLLLKSQGFTV